MRTDTPTAWSMRVVVALLLAMSLAVAGLLPTLPASPSSAVALDDDGGDDGDDDDAGGDIDEDDDDEDGNRGNGNDDDGDDDDNPGRGNDKEKKDKDKGNDDEENDFVTTVPTNTPDAPAVPTSTPVQRADPTGVVLTPVSSPTTTPTTTPVTTGTLLIRLRACPDGTDPSIGTAALRQTCLDGEPDADFELAGRSGVHDGWRRDVTTDRDGDARVRSLAEGTYALTLNELDWCAAEASSVDDGLIVIEPGETTEVTAYLCGDPGTPAGG